MLPVTLSEVEFQQLIKNAVAEVLGISSATAKAPDSESHQHVVDQSRFQPNKANPTRFLRLKQIIGDPKADPPISPILPISKSSWYAGIKSGRYPAGISISPRTTIWRADEVLAIAAHQEMGGCHEG
jgi:predicted DNA-binding transcriptional regulator AlpA